MSFVAEHGVVRAAAGKLDFNARAVATALPASLQTLLTSRVTPQSQEKARARPSVPDQGEAHFLSIRAKPDTCARETALADLGDKHR